MSQFRYRSMRLVNRLVCVSTSPRVRICNGYASEALPTDHPRLLFLFPIRIKQWVRRERIAMRPTIHCDAFNVASRIESSSTQHPRQLIPDIALERFEGRLHKFNETSAMLITWRKSWPAWRTQHEQHSGLLGITRKLVSSQAHREIKCGIRMISAERNDVVHAEFMERRPVAHGHMRVHQRRLHQVRKRLLLLLGKLRANVRDHSVVAR